MRRLPNPARVPTKKTENGRRRHVRFEAPAGPAMKKGPRRGPFCCRSRSFPPRDHVWMFSALQGVFDDDLNRRSGASHVSGLYEAALMAAGPDEVRGSDPNQNIEHFAHNP